jgi:hypothetical protein
MKIRFDALPDDNDRENIHNLSLISDDSVASNPLNGDTIKCKERKDTFLSFVSLGLQREARKADLHTPLKKKGATSSRVPLSMSFAKRGGRPLNMSSMLVGAATGGP